MGLDNPLHIAFLLIVLLLVFGAKRLPEIGRSIGTGMREFKDSISGQTPMLSPGPTQQQTVAQPVAAQQPQTVQAMVQQPQTVQAVAQQPQAVQPVVQPVAQAPVAQPVVETPAEPAQQA